VVYPGNIIEAYTYDNAQNRMIKASAEEVTKYNYDENNRLTQSVISLQKV